MFLNYSLNSRCSLRNTSNNPLSRYLVTTVVSTKVSYQFFSHMAFPTTRPHTPEQNDIAERRHRHIVETGLSLLHYAKLPLSVSSTKSQITQNLKSFGCLCYPWLRPYTTTKLQPKSTPCLFLGYSASKSAFKCYDLTMHRLYHSRHVEFVTNQFPSTHLPPDAPLPTPDTFLTPPVSSHIDTNSPPPPTPPIQEVPDITVIQQPTSPTHDEQPASPTHDDQPSSPTTPTPNSVQSHPPSPHISPIPSPEQPNPTRTCKPNTKYFNPSFVNSSTLHPIPTTIEPTTHTQALKDP
ncbi:hypothetical protein LXL04_026286 [Taraxacum kok-saghyz]